MAKQHLKLAPVVAVLNMKGGVGKTVLSGNVFREIFEKCKVRTLLVDFDAQFNLSQLLLTQAEYDTLKAANRTIYNVLNPPPPESVFAVSEANLSAIEAVDDFTEMIEEDPKNPGTEIRLVPGNFELAILNIREQPALRLPRKRFRSFIEKARESYELIVLDCNPSSSFITLSALEVATDLLIPVKPDRFALLGVELLTEFLRTVPTISTDLLKRTSIVLNDIQNSSDQSVIRDLRKHPTFGNMVLPNFVPHSKFLAPNSNYNGFAVDRKAPHRHEIKAILSAVADDLAKKLGVT